MKNKIYNKKVIIIAAIIAAVCIFVLIMNNNEKGDFEEIPENVVEKVDTKPEEEVKQIIVHVTGCVRKPGIVKVREKARLVDVVEAAGGTTEDADLTKVNLAYIVKDAQKIYIPSIYDMEEIAYISTENGENVIVNDNIGGNSNMVNINTATQTDLEQLPGIGPSTALKIINYRKEQGDFKSIEDIKNVPGIGDSKFTTIKEMIEI